MLWGGRRYRGSGAVAAAAVGKLNFNRKSGHWFPVALMLLLSSLAVLLWTPTAMAAGTARVTHDGTEGIRTQVLSICTDCHSTTNLQTPYMDSYSHMNAATPNSVGYCTGLTVAQCGNLRVQNDSMPAGGIGSASLKALMQGWIDDGILQRAAPMVNASAATSVSKYGATLNASVNENGAESTFYFEYGIGSYGLSTSTTTASGNGGAGSASNNAISRSVTGLTCGSTYQFRARGSSAAGSNIASGLNFNTLACPSISNITDRSISEDGSTGAIAFTLSDGSSTCGLSVSGTSSNTTLIPNANLSFSGSCSARSITVTPAANQFGSSTITVTVSDGTTIDTDTFVVTVSSVNDVPTISDISNQGTSEDVPVGPIAFTISDLETATATLQVSASSSNQTLLPDANISLGGSNGNRTISLTPALDQTGSATITVSVFDGVDTATDTFTLVVAGVNDNPVISDISNQAINEDNSSQVNFTISDNETAVGSLMLSASSSNTTLLPNSNLVFSGTGASRTLTATPVANASGSATVTVTVQDELFAAASDSYVLTVTAVNDAPVLAPLGNATVTELSAFATAASVTDVDDANDGSGALTFSLVGAPAGMVISATGGISWTPGENTAGSYPITVRVADGGEDGAAVASTGFTLTVQKLDSDSDTVADYLDNCPNTANTDQANNDADAQGDACDLDDDNDGMPDTIELARGLDPFDPSDAAGDLDGDGISNLDEYLSCVAANDPVCDAIAVDSVAPVITTNGDITVAAIGYVTDAGESATAEDGVDGTVAVTADVRGPFRPGLHVITWTAQDTAGNVTTAQQTVRVLPQVDIAAAMMVGEDQQVRLPILLSGPAPEYPLHVIYSVSGTGSNADHTLTGGSIAIASGEQGYLEFLTLPDAVTESDETIVVTATAVSSNGVLGANRLATITIVDRAVAPQLTLQMRQGGDVSQHIFADMGEVVVTAVASDANGDVLSYDWQFSDDSISYSTEANVLRFDPATVAVGAYQLTVTVSDADHTVSQSLPFVLQANAPVLLDSNDSDDDGVDDLAEGLQDSDSDGVLDYLDPVTSAHQLQINVTGADRLQRLLQTEAGLQLSLGEHAMAAQRRGARVSSTELRDGDGAIIADPRYDAIGEIYDFQVSGLTDVQPMARVVLPLAQSLPPDAVYRKLINGSWQSFVMIDDDDIYSAPLTDTGLCPSLEDDSWRIGLNRSDRCVRLRIRDGGHNDADGTVNGVVADPGVIAVAKAGEPEGEPTEGPNGGGGAMGIAGVLSVWLLLAWRRRKTWECAA